MSLPAAALTGLLLLGFVLAVDLAGQVQDATPAGSGLAGWARAQAPGLAAALAALLAVLTAVTLSWVPGAAVVVLAPALLIGSAPLALGRHRAPRRRLQRR
ncbi:MAG: hypothetical protein H0U77_07340 [Nocardioidaceae bacterium]|nr:hypothetical protein [Nocardioidaceae bacterium]